MRKASIKINWANSEIIVVLDKDYPDESSALEEAEKMLGREVIYRRYHPNEPFYR